MPRPTAHAVGASAVAVAVVGALTALLAGPASAAVATTSGAVAAHASSYPFSHASPGAVDPWGAYERQCTSYASWALAHSGVTVSAGGVLAGPKSRARLGNASNWDKAARKAGYRVSSTPVVGAVAQWHAGETSSWSVAGGSSWETAGPEGHVGIVKKVLPGGLALIDDYNGARSLGFSQYVGKAPRYLVITPPTH